MNDTDNIFSNDSKILRILINILPTKVPSNYTTIVKEYYNKKDLIKIWGHDKNNIDKSTGDEKTSHSPNCQDVKPSTSTSFSLPQIQSSNHILCSSNQQTRTNSNYVESKLKLNDLSTNNSRINFPGTSGDISNSNISNKQLQNQEIEELKKKRKSTRLSIINHKRLFL